MGELTLLKYFREHAPGHPLLRVGPGHDCAVIEWDAGSDIAYKIDGVFEGTHFVLSGEGAATPRQAGWKAVARSLSDIAAAGFEPVAVTVAVALRGELGDAFAIELYEGLIACCRRFGCALAGGDVSSTSGPVAVVVSAIGRGPRGGAYLRSGASPGDALFVTGELGGSILGKHLAFAPRLEEAKALRALGVVRASIDVSDGLARDLKHLCEESGVGAMLDEPALPVSEAARRMAARSGRPVLEHALGDGEDYELLFAVPESDAARLAEAWRLPTRLTRIGRFLPRESGLKLRRADGAEGPLPDLGYEHMRPDARTP